MRILLNIICLISLALSVAFGNETSLLVEQSSTIESDDRLQRPDDKTELAPTSPGTITLIENKDNGLEEERSNSEGDITLDELLLFESLFSSDSVFPDTTTERRQGSEDTGLTSATTVESRITSGDIRRQGDLELELGEKQQNSNTQFDDSKQDQRNPPLRFGERFRNPNNRAQDRVPMLQLTQGGYRRPYQQPLKFRNRQNTRTDSSEQSEKIQEPNENASNDDHQNQTPRRIAPQVSYSGPRFQQQPFTNSMFQSGLNLPLTQRVPASRIAPTAIQGGYFNAPPSDFLDFTNPAFRAQFPPSNEIAFSSFPGDPNSSPLYSSSQRNPFQNTELLYQSVPQVQPQPILIDPSRRMQFPPTTLQTYPAYENTEDASRANISPFFTHPVIGPQFQAQPNFYSANPNEGLNAFRNQPLSFAPNYPRSSQRFSPDFFRYPMAPNTQNEQGDQQSASDTSQEDKKAKEIESKDDKTVTNNERTSVQFGTRILPQNGEDVFVRYPTNEAGYAIEESMPSANGTDTFKENFGPSIAEGRHFLNNDPYRDALNALRSQKQNESRPFMPRGLFREVPIDFGYQRPENPIFIDYPDRSREIPNFQPPEMNIGTPFDQLTPLSENGYPFVSSVNHRRNSQNLDNIPLCAKSNISSFCFEDDEYPKNDVLYSVNSNSFLMDRMSGPDLGIDSTVFVEKNASEPQQNGENYACAVDTKYGSPLRGKSLDGSWRVIVNFEKFSQPVRIEVCGSKGDPCSYTDSKVKTTCVQKYSIQRLLTWSPDRGVFSDVFKIPVACSCQILEVIET